VVQRSLPRQLFRDFVYLVGLLPLGTIWLIVLITLLSTAFGLLIVIVGFVLLALTMLVWRWGANRERERAALILGAPLASAHRPLPPSGFFARWRVRVGDPATWKDLVFLFLVGTLGIVTAAVYGAAWALGIAGILAPALSAAAPAGSWLGGLGALALAGVCLGGFVVVALTLLLGRGLALMWGALCRGLLAPGERAALEARARALEASRAGAVESADARLRRIERDLHDGAQARLVAVTMDLGLAREKLDTDPETARGLMESAHEEASTAITELRELVAGIAPAVLVDRGLDAALSSLVASARIPVSVDVRLPKRVPASVEAAAYFVVAESLANVQKHAAASRADVRVRSLDGGLVVEVNDDGSGGADFARGSGLAGLQDRVAALDGTLTVTSPPGGPTLVRAEIPCAP
jgi:signal transduction histidine kinase